MPLYTLNLRFTPTFPMQIEVELNPDPSENIFASPVTSLDANRVRSVTVQPSYTTPQDKEEKEAECSDSDHIMEFTLTVQGSFDEARLN